MLLFFQPARHCGGWRLHRRGSKSRIESPGHLPRSLFKPFVNKNSFRFVHIVQEMKASTLASMWCGKPRASRFRARIRRHRTSALGCHVVFSSRPECLSAMFTNHTSKSLSSAGPQATCQAVRSSHAKTCSSYSSSHGAAQKRAGPERIGSVAGRASARAVAGRANEKKGMVGEASDSRSLGAEGLSRVLGHIGCRPLKCAISCSQGDRTMSTVAVSGGASRFHPAIHFTNASHTLFQLFQ